MKSKEVGERVRVFMQKQKKTQGQLADMAGLSRSVVSEMMAGKRDIDRLVEAIEATYGLEEGVFYEGITRDGNVQTGDPYYAVDFAMGYNIISGETPQNPDFLIDFPPYRNVIWCNAHGNSMYPTIASGDIVALKRIEDFSYLINGEIYAIVTKNDLRTIKRVHDNGDTITLIADNKEVEEQELPKDAITDIFIVKGAIKQF